jgi:hypothetical protein
MSSPFLRVKRPNTFCENRTDGFRVPSQHTIHPGNISPPPPPPNFFLFFTVLLSPLLLSNPHSARWCDLQWYYFCHTRGQISATGQLTVHDHGNEEGEESLGVENTIWAGAVVASGTATGPQLNISFTKPSGVHPGHLIDLGVAFITVFVENEGAV